MRVELASPKSDVLGVQQKCRLIQPHTPQGEQRQIEKIRKSMRERKPGLKEFER